MKKRQGILWFLGITFGLTYIVEFALIAAGVRFDTTSTSQYYGQLIIIVVMWFPALAAFVTAKFIMKEDADRFGLRLGAIRPYLIWMAMMPILFALIYGASWLLGLTRPDFEMKAFMMMMAEQAQTDLSTVPPSSILVPVLFLSSVVFVPIFNSLIALGEEIGWRGYLLPRLLPLGKPAAYAISGVIWGLWHLPLILVGFTYPGYPIPGIFAFILLASALNIIENELYLRYQRSTLLAAWIHGLFNTQKLGIWTLIFVGINPLLGGYSGLVGIMVFWGVALVVFRVYTTKQSTPPTNKLTAVTNTAKS